MVEKKVCDKVCCSCVYRSYELKWTCALNMLDNRQCIHVWDIFSNFIALSSFEVRENFALFFVHTFRSIKYNSEQRSHANCLTGIFMHYFSVLHLNRISIENISYFKSTQIVYFCLNFATKWFPLWKNMLLNASKYICIKMLNILA